MKKAKHESISLSNNQLKLNTNKKLKTQQKTVKTVQVDLECKGHRKMYSTTSSSKKMICLTNNLQSHFHFQLHTNNIINRNPNGNINSNTNPPFSQRKDDKKKVDYHHYKSTSVKEDIRKRNCRSLVKPQIYTTPQKTRMKCKLKESQPPQVLMNSGTSNCVLTTNFTEKDGKDDKSKKKAENNTSLLNIQNLRNIFRKSNLKQTIIIDEKGNTNLNMNFRNNVSNYRKTFCNSLKKGINIVPTQNTIKDDKIILQGESQSCTFIQENETNKKQEENIKEYEAIFNILNYNINQFNNLINNHDNDNDNNDQNLFLESPINIFTQKEKDEIACINNETYINYSNDKDNKNHHDNITHFDNNSFLDSCLQEDIILSFVRSNSKDILNHNCNDNISFNFSSLINKNETINFTTTHDQTECCNDDDNAIPIVLGLQTYTINPRLLLKDKHSSKKMNANKMTEIVNKEENKCVIY